uniref:MATH domain-containing protein n=1 Tax=Aegilops tauschii TaxID=37682 RepID=M8BV81_AEGTA
MVPHVNHHDGIEVQPKDREGYARLLTLGAKVRAGFDMSLVVPSNPTTTKLIQRVAPMVFDDTQPPNWGLPMFMKRAVLESLYLEDDRLMIKCEVTVFREPQVEETSPDFEVQVLPYDLYNDL